MASYSNRATLDGLPMPFVNYLRVLFDILDEQNSGYIRLQDIESRWEGGIEGLPSGVLDALRKVAPPNGRLSFERFVGGLKIALLRSKKDHVKPLSAQNHDYSRPVTAQNSAATFSKPDLLSNTVSSNRGESAFTRVRPKSPPSNVPPPPVRSSSHQIQPLKGLRHYHSTTAAVRPNNVLLKQSASMPQLGSESQGQDTQFVEAQPRPDQPPNYSDHMTRQHTEDMTRQEVPLKDKDGIVNALKNWQRDRIHSVDGARNPWTGDGRASIASTSALPEYGGGDFGAKLSNEDPGIGRRGRRREPRRHTLADGIDFNMIKRMKQLEQEKDILLSGLESVNRAREWYLREIQAVQDKQKYVGKSGPQDNSLEAHQEKINFQVARISEVNQQLKALVDSSEKGFPLHMNLAVSSPSRPKSSEAAEAEKTISRLKAQNRMLTEEVSVKSDQITQLETEKTQLVRAMFESRSKQLRNNNYTEDTSYI